MSKMDTETGCGARLPCCIGVMWISEERWTGKKNMALTVQLKSNAPAALSLGPERRDPGYKRVLKKNRKLAISSILFGEHELTHPRRVFDHYLCIHMLIIFIQVIDDNARVFYNSCNVVASLMELRCQHLYSGTIIE